MSARMEQRLREILREAGRAERIAFRARHNHEGAPR